MPDFTNPLHIGYTAVTGAVFLLFFILSIIFLCKKKYTRKAGDVAFMVVNALLFAVFFLFFALAAFIRIFPEAAGFSLTAAADGVTSVSLFGAALLEYTAAGFFAAVFGSLGLAAGMVWGLALSGAAAAAILIFIIVHAVKARPKKRQTGKTKTAKSVKDKKPVKQVISEPEVLDIASLEEEEAPEPEAAKKPPLRSGSPEETSAGYGMTGERFHERFLKNLDEDTTTYEDFTHGREKLEELMRQITAEEKTAPGGGTEDSAADSTAGSTGETAEEIAMSETVFAEARAFAEEFEREALIQEALGATETTDEPETEDLTAAQERVFAIDDESLYEESGEESADEEDYGEPAYEEPLYAESADTDPAYQEDYKESADEEDYEESAYEEPEADEAYEQSAFAGEDPGLIPAREEYAAKQEEARPAVFAAPAKQSERIVWRSRPEIPPGYVLPVRILSKETLLTVKKEQVALKERTAAKKETVKKEQIAVKKQQTAEKERTVNKEQTSLDETVSVKEQAAVKEQAEVKKETAKKETSKKTAAKKSVTKFLKGAARTKPAAKKASVKKAEDKPASVITAAAKKEKQPEAKKPSAKVPAAPAEKESVPAKKTPAPAPAPDTQAPRRGYVLLDRGIAARMFEEYMAQKDERN